MLRRINSHDLIIRRCQDCSCIMDMTTIMTNRNRQERKVFGQRACLVPFTITDKPCLFFSDDHNTLLFFCIVDVQKYKSSKTQNDKHTKIQKHAEMQQSEKGQNTKMILTGLCILSYWEGAWWWWKAGGQTQKQPPNATRCTWWWWWCWFKHCDPRERWHHWQNH